MRSSPPNTPQRIAITGASGFLGGHLARAFDAANHAVVPVVRDPRRLAQGTPGLADARCANLLDRTALIAAFAGVETVVANAALGSGAPDDADYEATNVAGTTNTVAAAHAAGARRVVLISTVAVYRTQPWHPISDREPTREHTQHFDWSRFSTDPRYSQTKTRAEREARALAEQLGLECVVLRPGPIYGSGDTRFTARLVAQASRRVRLVATVGVPLVHAGDVALAAVAGAERPVAGLVANLAGEPERLSHVVATLARLLGREGLTIPIPVPLGVRFDCAPARSQLGFSPRPLEAGLQEVVGGR